MYVSEIMSTKVASCVETDTLADVARLMVEADCGAIPVVAQRVSPRPIGIVTDRDICLAAYRTGKSLGEIRVHDAMTGEVRTCRGDATTGEAEYVMRDARVRRLPVVDERGALIGILSLADLAREAEHERRLSRPEVDRIEIGAALAAICAPNARA